MYELHCLIMILRPAASKGCINSVTLAEEQNQGDLTEDIFPNCFIAESF